jgi:PAS domain S-box-containing protein
MSGSVTKRILLVEDDAISALAERHALESAGYEVSVAATGVAAITKAAEKPGPDLILMDIELGKGIDGTEASERILAELNVPIIFLSTHSDPEIVARTERITSYGYVLKNSGDAVLLASIRMAFQLWDARQKLEQANRKAIDAATLQNELFEQVPGAIYQFQYFPDGTSRFPMASRNIELVYEVSPEEVATDATPAFQRIHPDDVDPVVASIIHSRDTLEVWSQDYRVILPTRGERWLRGRARPERLSDGSVLWHGFIADITAEKSLQTEIDEERRHLAAIIDGADVGTWEWNVQTGETRFNERWAAMFGYTLGELAPVSIETWKRFAHAEDLTRSNAALRAHFERETDLYECEIRARHRGGHWVWILDRGKVSTWTADGRPEWVFGTHQDISAQVAQQERLRQSEENFRTFFDTSEDFLWVLDGAGMIVDVNRTVLDRLGFAKEALVGRSILEVHAARRREEARKIVAEMILGRADTCPVPLVTRDGREIPVETRVAPAVWDGEKALFGVSRDISALALSEEKYARMTDSSPAMIGLRDSETGEFVEVNDTACRLLGFTREEIIGIRAVDRIGLDPELRMSLGRSIREDGTFENIEAQVRRKDGSVLDVLLFGTRVEVQDRRLDLITAIDIRKRKRAENELRTALAANQTLMAELNHCVKNNLAMVASLIRLKDADIGDAADLSDLESRVEAIASLHVQLQQSAQLDRVALRPYVERVLRSAFRGAPAHVAIEISISDEEVPTRHATTIGLILNELATNAAKYALPRTVDPRFSVTQSENADTGRTRLIIANSGPPIAADISLENPSSLGLRLVSALVSQIDGEISLGRDPETVFTIEYPPLQ